MNCFNCRCYSNSLFLLCSIFYAYSLRLVTNVNIIILNCFSFFFQASRAVARSGYLFVAPDWDFSVPLNRTKVKRIKEISLNLYCLFNIGWCKKSNGLTILLFYCLILLRFLWFSLRLCRNFFFSNHHISIL